MGLAGRALAGPSTSTAEQRRCAGGVNARQSSPVIVTNNSTPSCRAPDLVGLVPCPSKGSFGKYSSHDSSSEGSSEHHFHGSAWAAAGRWIRSVYRCVNGSH